MVALRSLLGVYFHSPIVEKGAKEEEQMRYPSGPLKILEGKRKGGGLIIPICHGFCVWLEASIDPFSVI